MKRKAPKPMQVATDDAASSLAKVKINIAEERRALEVETMIDNPYRIRVPDVPHELGVTDALKAMRNDRERRTITLRDDPLGHMYHRGRSDSRLGPAQYQAGRKFQKVYEQSGIGRLRSPGDIREHVDGGGIAQGGATDSQMQAHKVLAGWRAALGRDGKALVESVLIDKRTIREIAQARYGGATDATLKYVGRRFRECLSTLARDMGLSS